MSERGSGTARSLAELAAMAVAPGAGESVTKDGAASPGQGGAEREGFGSDDAKGGKLPKDMKELTALAVRHALRRSRRGVVRDWESLARATMDVAEKALALAVRVHLMAMGK